ncbi:hypothetical protein PLESTF_001091200 [Pleodorina starrii]|nr:hypothetical protein PLESTF_001091200 [Pleodorina starrii]
MAEDTPMAGAEAQLVDIEAAAAMVKKGKDLIDDDPQKAVELLCTAVRAYEKHYGPEAIECAPVYMYYGIAVYEVARGAYDALGTAKTTVEPIAATKPGEAETPAAGTSAAAEPEANAATGTKDEAKATAAQEGNDKAAAVPATEPAPAPAPVEDSVKKAAAASSEVVQEVTPADENDNKENAGGAGGSDAAATAAAAASGEEGGDGEEEEEEEEEEGGEEEGAGAAAGGDDDESSLDDMKLAWDVLEVARILYSKASDPDQHHERLAEVHKALGDIKGEQERFEEAVECYKQSLHHLEAMQPRNNRRLAEVQYKVSVVLTYLEQPEEALSVTQAALASLEAAVAETEEQLTALPADGSGGEAAEEEGRRLQAVSDDLRGVMSELHWNVEGLKETIANNNSLKEALKQAFLKANAEGAATGGTSAAAAAIAGTLSNAFSAPSNPTSAAPVVSLGTVGRGSKRITLQPTAAPAQPKAQGPGPVPAPAEVGKAAVGVKEAAAAAPGSKRTLEEVMGGAPGAGGVTAASGFGAVGETQAAGAQAGEQGGDGGDEQQAAKRVRTEAPAGEAAAGVEAK